MKDLDKDLNIISNYLDKTYEGLERVLDLLSDLKDHYDLYDFSISTLEEWEDRYSTLVNKVMYMSEEFDDFTFDGDSIREVEEEDE